MESLKVVLRKLQPEKSCIIEEYKNIKSNAFVTYDASNATKVAAATMKGQEHKTKSQSLLITYWLELEIERDQLENFGVLKATSKNAAK